ncbi:hypothetical protein V8C43DRAFT_294295 [Trichoderma afarasin]
MYRYKLRDKDSLEEGRVSLRMEEHVSYETVLCVLFTSPNGGYCRSCRGTSRHVAALSGGPEREKMIPCWLIKGPSRAAVSSVWTSSREERRHHGSVPSVLSGSIRVCRRSCRQS